MKQKILSIFLILCMALGMLAAGALAVETVGGRSVEQSSAATEITINDGASSNQNVPLNNHYDYSVAQYVIPAADLVQLCGKGIVDLTYFYTAQSNADKDRTLAIYFQEGERFDLESDFVPVDENGLVFSGVASLKDGQLHIDLDEVYLYGGQDLLVTLIDSTGSYKIPTYFFGTEGGSSRYDKRDGDSYDAQNLQVPGTHSTFVPKTQIGVINVEAHSITVSETASGTVSAPEEAPQGLRIPLTITPDEGYALESLTVMQGETVIEVSDDFTFIMPAGDVTISATFKQVECYDITVEGAANGTVTAPESAYESYTVTLTVTPDAGYALESLSVMQGQTAVEVTWVDDTTCTFTMPAGDVVICATFNVTSEVVLYDGTAERDYVPLNHYYKYSVAQYVIPAADLAAMQGERLERLAYFSSYTGTMNRTITVYLMEGNNLDVSEEFIQIAGATQVFSGAVSLVNGKLEINFDEFFFYTGQDLLVTVVDSTGSYISSADFYGVETDFESVRVDYRDEAAYDPMNLTSGIPDTFLPKMEILGTAITTNNITVEETANGTVTVPKSYYEGGTVTIKVTPDAGYALESLTVMQGETVIEVSEDFTFIMPSGDVTVIVHFEQLPEWSITATETANGTVTVPESFYKTGTVTLTVTPDAGYVLESLSVMENGTELEVTRVDATTYTFTMPAGDVEIRATFVVKMYVEVNDGESKSYRVPTATNYKYSVVQYVIPAEDLAELWGKGINGLTYYFDDPTYSTTRTLTIYLQEGENFDLENGFAPITDARQVFTGQVSLANGQMKIELDEVLVYTGRDLLVTLVDSTGKCVVSAWFCGEMGGISRHVQTDEAPYDVTNLPEGQDYSFVPRTQIHFEESVCYNVTVEETENGTVSVEESQPQGMPVQLTVTPDYGYVLESLTVMQGETEIEVGDDFTFIMPAGDVTISATFKQLERYDIAVEGAANGTVTVPESAYESYTVTLTVTPDEGYALESLTVMQGETAVEVTWVDDTTCTFTMPAGDVTVIVYFDPLPEWSITVEEMANGTVTAPESFYETGTVTLTVQPDAGCMLLSLTVMQGETAVEVTWVDDTTCTFTMPAGDVTVSAVFAVAEQLKVSLEDFDGDGWNGNKLNIYMETEGGTEVLLYGDLTIDTGRNAEYTLLVPADATLCVRWVKGLYAHECSFTITRSGITVHVQEKGSVTRENETGDLLARIEPMDWRDITVEVTGNGTVLVPQQGAVGHKVQLTPVPDEGYVLYDLVVMFGDVRLVVDFDYCFVMPDGEVTVIAEFQVPQSYSITVEDNEYVSVEVPSSALAGSEVTLTVRPKAGYNQDGLAARYNDQYLLLTEHWNGTYSFIMPSGDVTVTVGYEKDTHVSDHQEDGYKLIWYSGFETNESMLGLLNWDINGDDEYNWKWWEANDSGFGHEEQFMGSYSSNDLTTDNWLLLPEMSLQEGRDYLFTLMAQTYDDDEEAFFAVYVTTDGGQTLAQLGEKQYAPEELTKFTFDLSDYAGQTIQLVVSHEDTNDIGVLVVDCLCVYQEILTTTYYFDVDGFVPVEANFFGPNGETSYGHPVTHVEGNIYSVCVPDNMNCVMLVDAQNEILLGMGIDLPTDGSNLYIVAENTWSTYDDGTCDHQGETTWIDNGDGTHSEICDLCDTVLTEEPQAHTPGEAVKENETAGSYESVVYCADCGTELSRETIATHTHTLIAVEAKDPTYAIAGNTAYYYCDCGKYFSDAEGANEIAEGSWVVPALAVGKDNALAIRPTSTGTYATLLLGAELKMSFNVSAKDTAAYDRVFLQITKLGKTTDVEVYSSNSAALQFRYALAAPEMTVAMTVAVCGEKDGQIYVGEVVTFTYRDIVIDKMDAFYNGTNETNKVHGCALLANLLKYGEEAQKRFGINTDDLATSGLSETYLAMINSATPALDTWTAPATATYYLGSYTPMLQEQIKIAFTFVVPSYSSLEGYEVRIVQTMSKDSSVKEHIFGADVLKSPRATQIRCDYAIAGAEGRDQLAITLYKDGVAVSETVVTNLSALAQGKQSDALNPLLYAMVNYCDAAKVFFG